MPLEVHPDLRPPGGRFVFINLKGVIFTAGTFPELVGRVESYRKRNGEPYEGTHQELTEYICARFPSLARQVPG